MFRVFFMLFKLSVQSGYAYSEENLKFNITWKDLKIR
ncbi:hypothetical protein IMPR6_100105 [Imperialibacter sp. EC-SDR9]|nr:hypothetical protein IMPERIA89_450088 [Imperialibacter sp. 89]CAD5292618.1 hypothetical protein IMPERIA75_650087 [Imperialibacter sp. 75]VVS99599.1 hypothetical protein IMPR6_100105 [Imperialibacter sp. EC-SDR9]